MKAISINPMVVQDALNEMVGRTPNGDVQNAFSALQSATHRAVRLRAIARRVGDRFRSIVGNKIPCQARDLGNGRWIVFNPKPSEKPPRCWKCQLCWELACAMANDAESIRNDAHDTAVDTVKFSEELAENTTGLARATARGRAGCEDRNGRWGGYHD